MYRRQVLAGAGTIVLTTVSGCLDVFGDDGNGVEGDDDDPIDAEPESLLLSPDSAADVTEAAWIEMELDERLLMYLEAEPARTLREWDEEVDEPVFAGREILTGVWFHDSVESARETYDDSPFQFGHGFEEEEIAVESITGTVEEGFTTEWGHVLFRDANVVGGVSYQDANIDERELLQTTVDLGAAMHESWRT